MRKVMVLGCKPYKDGRTFEVKVAFNVHPPHTTCSISLKRMDERESFAWLGTGSTALGKGDKWDTNAGMRIAFERALARVRENAEKAVDGDFAVSESFVAQLRRAIQIELAILRADRKGRVLYDAIKRCGNEYANLLRLRANDYEPVPKGDDLVSTLKRAVIDMSLGLGPRMVVISGPTVESEPSREPLFGYPVTTADDSKFHGDPKAEEPLRKPDSYKAIHEHEAGTKDFPVQTHPKVAPDHFPEDCAECRGDCNPCDAGRGEG